MTRHILPEDRVHPAAREKIAANHRDIVEEVEAALREHEWVIVGMAQNPVVKKARTLLKEKGLAFHYLEYGSYLKLWRRRNALKMWTGWPTFPMVFHQGVLIGGFEEAARLLRAEAPASAPA
ncbi:MAG: glutaredoxin [Sandaracinus sp.]|nr:glutaredoxin [Sandaracinus sp.]